MVRQVTRPVQLVGQLLLLLPGFLSLVGCSRDVTHANSQDPVQLALNWFPESEHGGFFAAQVHGYFEQEGVSVEILPGGPGAPVIQQVATGRVSFAIANADQVLLGRAQGAPVVAVMAVMQDSPRCIMVHAQSGIRSLHDLKNLTLSVGAGKPFAQFLLHELGDAGLTIVPYQGNVTAFLQKSDYAQQAYVFSEPYVARQHGAEPVCLMLSECGYNPYTSVLITHEDTIARRPELVAQVVQASLRGWAKYLESPESTNRRIHQLNPEMGLEILAYGAESIAPLCQPPGSDVAVLGRMNPQRWEQLADQLHTIGLLDDMSVWQQAFDLRFLPPDA